MFADASTVWWTAPTIVARTNNFYRDEGLNVKTFDVTTGLASKNAVISGNADIGLVASTPLAIGAAKKEPIVILGSYVESSHLISLISKLEIKESPCALTGSNCQDLLKSLKVAYIPGTISEYYFLNYLDKHGLKDMKSRIQENLLVVRPPAVPNAFMKGDINTAIIWEPLASLISDPLEKNDTPILAEKEPEPLYTLRLYLITTPKIWNSKKDEVLRFVYSVAKAGAELNEKKDHYRSEMERHFKYHNGWLQNRWQHVDFTFKTDKENIKKLIREDARLSIDVGTLKQEPGIDYMFDKITDVEKYLHKRLAQ